MNECHICFQEKGTDDLNFLVCGHFFCRKCIHEWTSVSTTCPLCRKFMCVSSEHFSQNENDSQNEQTYTIHLNHRSGKFAGITVYEKGGNEICIKKIDTRDCFFVAGIRKGDVIRKINGQKIKTHQQCIGVIEQIGEQINDLYVTIRRSPFSSKLKLFF